LLQTPPPGLIREGFLSRLDRAFTPGFVQEQIPPLFSPFLLSKTGSPPSQFPPFFRAPFVQKPLLHSSSCLWNVPRIGFHGDPFLNPPLPFFQVVEEASEGAIFLTGSSNFFPFANEISSP